MIQEDSATPKNTFQKIQNIYSNEGKVKMNINDFSLFEELNDLESSEIRGGASLGDVMAICIKNSPEVTTPIVGPAIATGICSFGALIHGIF